MTVSRKPSRSRPSAAAGFTLIELLLVLVILAVLAAVVVPRFTGQSERARVTAARTEITVLEGAIDRFEIDAGRYPTTEEGLRVLLEQPGGVNNWYGPYLKKGLPVDPWGNQYVYRYPGSNNPNSFDLFSMGPDGREGNDDIGNW